ncbi:1,4-alpha-glucan-branching enzyme 3, chloroplastic/amyloplastic, partial [Tanacetum coccineum]
VLDLVMMYHANSTRRIMACPLHILPLRDRSFPRADSSLYWGSALHFPILSWDIVLENMHMVLAIGSFWVVVFCIKSMDDVHKNFKSLPKEFMDNLHITLARRDSPLEIAQKKQCASYASKFSVSSYGSMASYSPKIQYAIVCVADSDSQRLTEKECGIKISLRVEGKLCTIAVYYEVTPHLVFRCVARKKLKIETPVLSYAARVLLKHLYDCYEIDDHAMWKLFLDGRNEGRLFSELNWPTGPELVYSITSTCDRSALLYLILANETLHSLHPNIITIAEDATLYPELCEPTSQGGLGFDYYVNPRASDMWLSFLEDVQESNWSMSKSLRWLIIPSLEKLENHIVYNVENSWRWVDSIPDALRLDSQFLKTYSRNPKPKAAVKLQSSYADIKLPPSDDDDKNEEDENQSDGIRRLNTKERANEKNLEISITDKETKKTEKRDMIMALAVEQAKQEAMKDDPNAYTMLMSLCILEY